MDFQNFLAFSLCFLFPFHLPDSSHSHIQLPGWLGEKKMHISLSLSICCVCVCENAIENGLNLIWLFIGRDRCLEFKKGGFFEAFYPTHPRFIFVFILINFMLWWYGCGLVVVVGQCWWRCWSVVVAVWLMVMVANIDVADEVTIVGMSWPRWYVYFNLFTVIYFR